MLNVVSVSHFLNERLIPVEVFEDLGAASEFAEIRVAPLQVANAAVELELLATV